MLTYHMRPWTIFQFPSVKYAEICSAAAVLMVKAALCACVCLYE